MEVINTQAGRTLLLCEKHVAMVRSKSIALRSTYRSMWAVPIADIKIVRGKSLMWTCIDCHALTHGFYSTNMTP